MQPRVHTDDVISDLGNLIKGIRPEQMSNPTPCAKWTVHDLVNQNFAEEVPAPAGASPLECLIAFTDRQP